MKTPRRILVAVKNPGSRRQPALHKAAQLVHCAGANVERSIPSQHLFTLDALPAAGPDTGADPEAMA